MSAASTVSHAHFRSTLGTDRGPHGFQSIPEIIRKNGSACIPVHEGGMFPWFRTGDLVFVRRCDFESVSVGDVILFEQGGELLLHRVIRRIPVDTPPESGTALVAKGDAANSVDMPATAQQFVGRAIRIHRRKRHIDLESLERRMIAKVIARVSDFAPMAIWPLRALKMLFA